MTKWPLQKECDAFFGNPRGANDNASAAWESKNLTSVKCPWVLRYAGKPVSGIRVHKKVAASLERVLKAIWDRVGHNQSEIDRIGMSVYGGGYNFRAMRGGTSLSMHSYGCAVDFDPANNGLGDKTPKMDRRVIEEFEREGWEWGGHWSRPDGMHFQAALTRANPKRLPPSSTRKPLPEPVKPAAPATVVPAKVEVERLQASLKNLGYFEVGEIDGKIGTKTRGALLAFKNDNGLPLNDQINDETWIAIAKAKPRPAPAGRADAKTAPSLAAKTASATKVVGTAAIVVGATETALEPVGGISGAINQLSGAADTLKSLTGLVAPIRDLFNALVDNWMVALLVAGVGLYAVGRRVFKDELSSYKAGEWS